MSRILNAKNEKSIVDYIKSIMMNRDIDCDNDWWESEDAKKEISSLAVSSDCHLSNSEKLKINSNEALIVMNYFSHKDDGKLIEKIESELNNFLISIEERGKVDGRINIKEINLIIFINNYKNKIRLRQLLDKSFEKKLRSHLAKRGYKKIKVDQLYVFNNANITEEIKISNINRYEAIQMPPINYSINWESYTEKNDNICGYVFNVELYQLVDLYNKIGDRLFKKNVRYGINEQFGVDSAIKDTLENCPDMFWFRNNGVTLLVEKENFKLNRVGEIVLSYDSTDELDFSVVNGAQTITAAADFYYTKEYEYEIAPEKNLEDLIKKIKNVRVMLRIINIKDLESVANESKQISVALNRQKPIKAEDIAFSLPYIEKLISYIETRTLKVNNGFKLVKRGESLLDEICISLPDFVRAKKACVGKPGDARSKGINNLLEYSSNGSGYSFNDQEIFVPDWEEAEGSDLDEIFDKEYGAILFAVKLAEIYDRNRKDINSVIANNGKWYFVALILAILTEESPNDYSDFEYEYVLSKDQMLELISCFTSDVEKTIKKYNTKYPVTDSNQFKKNDLFKDVIKEMVSVNSVLKLKDKVLEYFEISTKEKKKLRSSNIKIDTIILKSLGRTINVKDQSEALVETFKAYLYENELKLDKLVEEISILSFEKVGSGYFRGDNNIDVNGRTIYIGTSTNFGKKCNELNNLANTLELSNGEIVWKGNGIINFENGIK